MCTTYHALKASLTAMALFFGASLMANNINVTSVTLAGNTGTTVNVQFNITWNNSWRGNGTPNHDAAWVFVKYRLSNGLWQHARLNNTGHTAPTGSLIETGLLTPGTAFNATTNPVIGVFIRRSADGTGTFTATGAQLNWNYSSAGVAFADISEVRVFAIEMVFVPEGAFFVGTGGTETSSFTDGAWVSGPSIPRQISSEGAITLAPSAGNLWGALNGGFSNMGATGTLPAAFPKGFRAFYCMKYEISQQQFVDFLNTLTIAQQSSVLLTSNPEFPPLEYAFGGGSSRNGIAIQISGSFTNGLPATYGCNLNFNTTFGEASDGRELALNNVTPSEILTYLDWSGLRPMTELEFEKACRGPLPPVPNEYPWGTAAIASGSYTLVNPGAFNEGIATNYSTTSGNARHSFSTPNGPTRVGIFAGNASNTGRITSGASYYGIMEMGGNISELVICVDNAGRSYTGIHGNGTLAANGSDVSLWPLAVGLRGGGWSSAPAFLRTSNRSLTSSSTTWDGEFNQFGGRGIRNAP